MQIFLRCALISVFSIAIGSMIVSAQPLKRDVADTKLVIQSSPSSFDPAPVSMLFVGGALLVFGGILRRRLRT